MLESRCAASPATTETTAAPREVRLVSRPVGWPTHADFEVVESEVPDLADGQIRVRNTVMSVDPYMRGRMAASKSYAASVEIGEVMEKLRNGIDEARSFVSSDVKGVDLGKVLRDVSKITADIAD